MQIPYIINILLKFLPIILFFSSGFSHIVAEEDSVYIFQRIGLEPTGRYIMGALELAVGFLLIMPGRSLESGLLGGILALGMVVVHLTVLGIPLKGDEGYRFVLALILLFSCWGLVFINRKEIKGLPQKLARISWRNIKMP